MNNSKDLTDLIKDAHEDANRSLTKLDILSKQKNNQDILYNLYRINKCYSHYKGSKGHIKDISYALGAKFNKFEETLFDSLQTNNIYDAYNSYSKKSISNFKKELNTEYARLGEYIMILEGPEDFVPRRWREMEELEKSLMVIDGFKINDEGIRYSLDRNLYLLDELSKNPSANPSSPDYDIYLERSSDYRGLINIYSEKAKELSSDIAVSRSYISTIQDILNNTVEYIK